MSIESSNDLIEMLADWDVAKFNGFEVPCILQDEADDDVGVTGNTPVITCAGYQISNASAQVRDSVNRINAVANGDVISEIVRQDATTDGPFTVKVVRPDGSGLVRFQLER